MARLEDISLFVLDMDGTIYLGEQPFPCAVEFISKAKKAGKKVVFFTNNSSKNPKVYYDKLHRLGFEADIEDIVTSGDVTAEFLLKNHPGAKVFLLGTPFLEKAFEDAGINLTDKTDADIVVSAFDTTLTYEKLEKACTLIRNGALFYSTHPDFNCPTETGFIPDSGAICAFITASTGVKPRYFGKPYKETAEIIMQRFNTPKENTAVVGDRLYTDIALGRNNGITSILVLSGESTREDVNDDNAPTYIFKDIGELIKYL